MKLKEEVSSCMKMWLTLVFVTFWRIQCFCLPSESFKAHVGENSKPPTRPHIVVLISDDMGFNDVSYRIASKFLTPNIDAMGYQGIILNRFYGSDMCSPSRASLLTGRYSVNMGMQHAAIRNCQPYGLPLDLKILPEYLKGAGYRTHLVGKWHLGYCRKEYTPNYRGFDSFFGFNNGVIDFYTRMASQIGYDFRRNMDVSYENLGNYVTTLFTNESLNIIEDHDPKDPLFLLVTYNAPHASVNRSAPLQAPEIHVEQIDYVEDPETKIYAAMVEDLDRGIGKIVSALSKKKMLSNTLLMFFPDNGAVSRGLFETKGSNYPLRGQKHGPWEGGTRLPAVLWTPPALRHRMTNRLVHITDLMPTFLAMAGVKATQPVDGYNIWATLLKDQPSPRNEMIHNINPIEGWSSYYYRGWKYVNGTTTFNGLYPEILDSWYGERAMSLYQLYRGRPYADIVRTCEAWRALVPFAQKSLTSENFWAIRNRTKVTCQSQMPYASCNPLEAPCLFKLNEDPCEMNNLAKVYPFQLYLMKILVNNREATSVYPFDPPEDLEGCNPVKFNGTYTPWFD